MPVIASRTVTARTTTHDLSLNGRAGAVLIILLITLATFIIAFATSGWSSHSGYGHSGLWETCRALGKGPDYHVATQVLMCLALIGLLIAVILIFLYLFVNTVSKYQVLLALVIDSFITVVLMLIGIIVFGAKANNVWWSYGVAVIANVLCLVAAIIAAVQLARC